MARTSPTPGALPTSGPLPADGSGPPTAIPIVEPADDAPPANGWGRRQVTAGFAIDLDAAHLVDAMTRAALLRIRDALMTGQRPDGGGEQKPLSARAALNPGRLSEHRGFASGELADGLRRTAIESDGRTARAKIFPPTSRTAYVAKEQKRGVVLLTGAGAVGEAAVAAARATAEAMGRGLKIEGDRGETDAGKEAA